MGYDYQQVKRSVCHNCDGIDVFVTIIVTESGPISKNLLWGGLNISGKREKRLYSGFLRRVKNV